MPVLFAASAESVIARKRFRAALLRWYNRNKRDLPWRRTQDPFQIWVSEIMLQQTRVAAVLDHYRRFFQQFPTVAALARAREQRVLAAWSGLGYYRRARMLHQAAKRVVARHHGRLPATTEALETLPGIGRYTAAAIASIAFREPVAVVDGNVQRVISRIAGRELLAATYWSYAQQLLDPARPGDFNQAMMELGATVCLARTPNCKNCPAAIHCATRGEICARKIRAGRHQAQRDLALSRKDNRVLLEQRSRKESVMPGMWELPEYKGPAAEPLLRVRHSIMNTHYQVRVFASEMVSSDTVKWVSFSGLRSLPLTGMSRKVLRKLNLLQ